MADSKSADARGRVIVSRKSFRSPVAIPAELFVSAGARFKVAVRDLSASGFRVETANHIQLNSTVYLTIPGIQSLQARVAWNDREHYGCEFARPLYGSIYEDLSRRFPSFN